MGTKDVNEQAALFMQTTPKRQLAQLARTHGWRGDDARTSKFQIALYCAQAGLEPEQQKDSGSMPEAEGGQGTEDQRKQKNGDQGSNAKSGDSSQQKGEGQGQGGDSGKGQGEQSQGDGQSEGDSDAQGDAEGEGEQSDGDSDTEQQGKPKSGKGKEKPADGSDGEKGEGKGKPQQQPEPEPEQPEQRAPNNKEWADMLKAAGIERPHPMLRKVHALAVVAKVHVMLVGPAGCGKTMLAAQLAQLLGYAFGLNSMTAGTSESALTGWLLPVGEAGKFEYVPAPFVTNYKHGRAVHLLDEADAADANLLLVMNAALANGHLPISHNLKEPMVKRSDTNYILAACNTTGGGADDLYTSRTALDASTLDRFYMVRVDYASDYEGSLFGINAPMGRGWTPRAAPLEQTMLAEAHAWLCQLRGKVNSLKIPRIVSTRMFQKVRAALVAGLSFKEIKADLLMAWSPDELRRCNEVI